MNAGFIGMGKYVPSHVLTNADLEKRLDTSDEWIRTMTGIEERRIADDSTDTSHMAYNAAVEAINNAGIKPEEIGLILVATVTPIDHFHQFRQCSKNSLAQPMQRQWTFLRLVQGSCTAL